MKPLVFSSNPRQGRSSAPQSRAIDVPEDFSEVADCLAPTMDRKLGYFGSGRFVAFHYEPRAEDVIWRDERSFGIGTGAWQVFLEQVQPLAELYNMNVGGTGRAADHVLVFDRVRLMIYFATRASAEAFLGRRRQLVGG